MQKDCGTLLVKGVDGMDINKIAALIKERREACPVLLKYLIIFNILTQKIPWSIYAPRDFSLLGFILIIGFFRSFFISQPFKKVC